MQISQRLSRHIHYLYDKFPFISRLKGTLRTFFRIAETTLRDIFAIWWDTENIAELIYEKIK